MVLCAMAMRGQSIKGVVRYMDGKPAADANVIFKTIDNKRIIGYTVTTEGGNFNFKMHTASDSVMIMVTGFNLKKTVRKIPADTKIVNFIVEYEALKLNEVVVKAEPIIRKGDTLKYIVASFADTLVDYSIGDVLKKMPGIEVTKNGRILYNNHEINKFYIEGLDMMGGRYGVAVKNVRAKDIHSVEVLENHQPIKALEGFEYSKDAAVNLRLKKSAKGSLIATLRLGVGYKPWMWDEELVSMYFTGKWQMMGTYKTNNSAHDITSELESFYDQLQRESSSLSVHTPSAPDTDHERYMDNKTHAVSISGIFRLCEDSDRTINVNGMYKHERQDYNSTSLTIYYFPGESSLEINENTSAVVNSDETEVKLKYNLNDKRIYLNEQIAFGAAWNDNTGMVINAEDRVGQEFEMHQTRLQNNLRLTKILGKDSYMNFASRIYAADMPSNLRVSPVLYPEIFGYEAQEALQEMSNRKLLTDHVLDLSKRISNRIKLSSSLRVTTDIQEMTSGLFDKFPHEEWSEIPDSLRNDMRYRGINVMANAGVEYRYGDLRVLANITPSYTYIMAKDRVIGSNGKRGKSYINPSVTVDWTFTQNLSFHASGGKKGYLGSVSSIYSGYIMTDYRQIGSREGEIVENDFQNYTGELRYSDALMQLFGSFEAGYWRNASNIMYGTRYYGSLSKIQSYAIDNVADGWSMSGKVEKRFGAIATTIGIPVGYNNSRMDVFRQGEIMKTTTTRFSAGLEVSTRLSASSFFDYDLKYSRSGSKIKGSAEKLDPINALHQKLSLDIVFLKKITMNLTGEDYYNDAISSGNRNLFFLDASLSFKTKKFEYVLEGRNLLNVDTYNRRFYSEMTNLQYNYRLRPAAVMLRIKFSIGA